MTNWRDPEQYVPEKQTTGGLIDSLFDAVDRAEQNATKDSQRRSASDCAAAIGHPPFRTGASAEDRGESNGWQPGKSDAHSPDAGGNRANSGAPRQRVEAPHKSPIRQSRDELFSTVCACGSPKYAKQSFCRECYFALPMDRRRALYTPIFGGYPVIYAQCKEMLKRAGRIDADAKLDQADLIASFEDTEDVR